MRHAGLDEDEVPRLVLDDASEARAVLVAHPALENVEHDLEIDVNVGVGHSARWNRRNVHRKLLRADVLAEHAGLVADPVPITPGLAAANHLDAFLSLDTRLRIQAGFRHRALLAVGLWVEATTRSERLQLPRPPQARLDRRWCGKLRKMYCFCGFARAAQPERGIVEYGPHLSHPGGRGSRGERPQEANGARHGHVAHRGQPTRHGRALALLGLRDGAVVPSRRHARSLRRCASAFRPDGPDDGLGAPAPATPARWAGWAGSAFPAHPSAPLVPHRRGHPPSARLSQRLRYALAVPFLRALALR